MSEEIEDQPHQPEECASSMLDATDSETVDSSTKTDELRVRNVSEINDNAKLINGDVGISPTTSNDSKRKLPSWMLGPNSSPTKDTKNKRVKTSQNIEEDMASCSSDAVKTAAFETSANSSPTAATDAETDAVDKLITSNEPSSSSNTTVVKNEPESTDETEASATTSNAAGAVVKSEPESTADSSAAAASTSNANIKPAVKVEKADASSTSRESCKFGIRCYRRNPMHRIEEAHPGDHDYKRPSYPAPPDGTPDCPYGNLCYRRNPTHFQQYNHPADTDFKRNYQRYRLRRRKRLDNQANNNDGSDLDDYDLDDPFIDDDSDLDYAPSNDDDDDTDLDYDDCDKAEE